MSTLRVPGLSGPLRSSPDHETSGRGLGVLGLVRGLPAFGSGFLYSAEGASAHSVDGTSRKGPENEQVESLFKVSGEKNDKSASFFVVQATVLLLYTEREASPTEAWMRNRQRTSSGIMTAVSMISRIPLVAVIIALLLLLSVPEALPQLFNQQHCPPYWRRNFKGKGRGRESDFRPLNPTPLNPRNFSIPNTPKP